MDGERGEGFIPPWKPHEIAGLWRTPRIARALERGPFPGECSPSSSFGRHRALKRGRRTGAALLAPRSCDGSHPKLREELTISHRTRRPKGPSYEPDEECPCRKPSPGRGGCWESHLFYFGCGSFPTSRSMFILLPELHYQLASRCNFCTSPSKNESLGIFSYLRWLSVPLTSALHPLT